MPAFRETAAFTGVKAIKATAAALLCEVDGAQVWIPQSQIDDASEVWEEGQAGELVVSMFIAESKGLV